VSEASGTVSGRRDESFFIFLIRSRMALANKREISVLTRRGVRACVKRRTHLRDRAYGLHLVPVHHYCRQQCEKKGDDFAFVWVGAEMQAPLVRVSLRRLSTRPVTDVTSYAAGR
jgi:hypothetical protein